MPEFVCANIERKFESFLQILKGVSWEKNEKKRFTTEADTIS